MKPTYLFITKQHQNIIIIKIILLAKLKVIYISCCDGSSIWACIFMIINKIRCQNCEIWPKYILQMFLTLIQLNG